MNALQYLVNVLCTENNLRKKELAEKIGISPMTLSQNLAKGKPSMKTFVNLANAFGVSADYIIERYNLTTKNKTTMVQLVIIKDGNEWVLEVPADDIAVVYPNGETIEVGFKSGRSNVICNKMRGAK